MLEALLSARRRLYISWSGRSVRDNSEQPPSVLVSQLRDYLCSGWGANVIHELSTEHPLQPFSRRYFEADQAALFTHAREWRDAYLAAQVPEVRPEPARGQVADAQAETATVLSLADLSAFLKNPVKAFFKRRLLVQFQAQDVAAEDDEAFGVAGLLEHSMLRELMDELLVGLTPDPQALELSVTARAARLRRAGRLPMGEQGRRVEQKLIASLTPMLQTWADLRALYPLAAPKELLRFPFECDLASPSESPALEDWLADLQCQQLGGQRVWFELTASRLCQGDKAPTVLPERLLDAWVRQLAAAACGLRLQGVIVGQDATVTVEPLPQERAQALLGELLAAWHEGMAAPLPLALKTGLAQLSGKGDPALVYEGGPYLSGAEGDEPCLARLFPDFAALSADGRFEALAERLYGPLAEWVQTCARLERHAVNTDARELAA